MNIEQSADRLAEKIRVFEHGVVVGVGLANCNEIVENELVKSQIPCIYVYTIAPKQKALCCLKHGWEEFPVIIKKSGRIRPALYHKCKEQSHG